MKYGIALLILLTLAFPVQAQAATVESGSVYCFSQADFSGATQGAALLETPESGVLSFGSRILRAGDVLTAEQLAASSEELTASSHQSAQASEQVAQSVTNAAGTVAEQQPPSRYPSAC